MGVHEDQAINVRGFRCVHVFSPDDEEHPPASLSIYQVAGMHESPLADPDAARSLGRPRRLKAGRMLGLGLVFEQKELAPRRADTPIRSDPAN